jgi:hypothetical protein
MFEHRIKNRSFQIVEGHDRDLGRFDIRKHPVRHLQLDWMSWMYYWIKRQEVIIFSWLMETFTCLWITQLSFLFMTQTRPQVSFSRFHRICLASQDENWLAPDHKPLEFLFQILQEAEVAERSVRTGAICAILQARNFSRDWQDLLELWRYDISRSILKVLRVIHQIAVHILWTKSSTMQSQKNCYQISCLWVHHANCGFCSQTKWSIRSTFCSIL